ncbi:MAG: tetratricopeptide repeat protein [Abitibacteriaceae bacterium]|nr:tetratricopeptide repeat protein [Abditibacteriaceae bacterium]
MQNKQTSPLSPLRNGEGDKGSRYWLSSDTPLPFREGWVPARSHIDGSGWAGGWGVRFFFLSLLFILTSLAVASPRGDGWKLHKAGRNEDALPLLQQAVRDNPNDAKAYWFLAQTYDDMGRGSEGLDALQHARQLDPSLSFAGSAASVQNVEQSLTRKSGGGSTSTGAATGSSSSSGSSDQLPATSSGGSELGNQQEILRSLQQTGVYVAPAMQNVADPAQIAQRLNAIQPKPNFKTDVLVFRSAPRRYRSVGQWAEAIHKNLVLKNDLVVVATSNNIGAYGANLNKAELQDIVQSSVKTFTAEGYPAGIAQVVRMASQEHASNTSRSNTTIFAIIAVPLLLVFVLVRRRKKQGAQDLAQAQSAARELSSQIAPAFEKLDNDFEYAIVGEQDAKRKQLLQERRQQVGKLFSDSMRSLNNATTPNDFWSARNALQMTQVEMQKSHNILQGRPENEGVQNLPAAAPMASNGAQLPAPAQGSSDVVEIPPIGANYPGARQDYALDFFTSQPVPTNQMVPVDIEVNGQRRRVWASPQSAQSALAGNPQIATMNYQGQMRPWFDVPQQQYNPWQNFGSTILQMAAFNLVWDSLMDRHSYYNRGWEPGYGGGYYGGGNYGPSYTWNDYDRGGSFNRDSGYDSRMNDASRDAGSASLNSPLSSGWDNSPDDAGSASLDVFGGGGVSGGGSS